MNPVAPTVGDLNQDGHQDLIVSGHDNSVVLLGSGDAAFQLPLNLPTVVGYPAIGDYNLDGKLDLATSRSILLGNGDGTFQPEIFYAPASSNSFVAEGDFNTDGRPDLVTIDESGSAVAVFIGNGDATFQPASIYPVPPLTTSIVIADFNSDAKPDLASVNKSSTLAPRGPYGDDAPGGCTGVGGGGPGGSGGWIDSVRKQTAAAFSSMAAQSVSSATVTLNEVDQAHSYMREQMGRLAIILCNKDPHVSAYRERLTIFNGRGKEVILFITKEQLKEMLYIKERGEDPSDLIIDLLELLYIQQE